MNNLLFVGALIAGLLNNFNLHWIVGKDIPFLLDMLLGLVTSPLQVPLWVIGLVGPYLGLPSPLFNL